MTAPIASGWSESPGGACTHWKAPPLHGARRSRTLRRGRLRIQQHDADMGLPELGDVLRGDCPKREAVAVGERCSLYYPQLLRLW